MLPKIDFCSDEKRHIWALFWRPKSIALCIGIWLRGSSSIKTIDCLVLSSLCENSGNDQNSMSSPLNSCFKREKSILELPADPSHTTTWSPKWLDVICARKVISMVFPVPFPPLTLMRNWLPSIGESVVVPAILTLVIACECFESESALKTGAIISNCSFVQRITLVFLFLIAGWIF